MQRYKCVIAYDGTSFFGYQIQPQKTTVQSELESALTKIHKGQPVRVVASGRTDAGVHAKGQVIHFDTMLNIPQDKWVVALNSLLPEAISVLQVEQVPPGFHSRFDAIAKEYRYFIFPAKVRDPFSRNYAYQYPYSLDISKMKAASKLLLGTHDFTSFCSAKTEVSDRVRTINEIEIFHEDELIVFRFVGNGFLYNMVRILVGTLIEIGSNQRDYLTIPQTIAAKDRGAAGKTAPAHGLYLWKVFY